MILLQLFILQTIACMVDKNQLFHSVCYTGCWVTSKVSDRADPLPPPNFCTELFLKKTALSRFVTVVLDGVTYTRCCPCFSVVPEGQRCRGAHEGRCITSNSPLRVQDQGKGVVGRNRRKYCFSDKGPLICPPG